MRQPNAKRLHTQTHRSFCSAQFQDAEMCVPSCEPWATWTIISRISSAAVERRLRPRTAAILNTNPRIQVRNVGLRGSVYANAGRRCLCHQQGIG